MTRPGIEPTTLPTGEEHSTTGQNAWQLAEVTFKGRIEHVGNNSLSISCSFSLIERFIQRNGIQESSIMKESSVALNLWTGEEFEDSAIFPTSEYIIL